MIQNLHFEKVAIWLQIDRNPYMVADNRVLLRQCGGSNPGPLAHKTKALPTAPQEH